ncbi:hypothetical protein CU097_010881 [Rhizopus azygosporus]|uniref:GH16 domain-containing protein n=1 Tax=Rhizopus azygosporus TaxID=86630 RepID=A0A367JE24_RHIAZ|nr:hypothetical protein CU097_010881 [Rhizopus azygosporus]
MFTLLFLILVICAQLLVAQKPEPVVCDCGFIDENDQIWHNIWYADYRRYTHISRNDAYYQLMDYTVPPKQNDTLARIFSPQNIEMDAHGLSLRVKGQKDKYTSAAIGTRRSDILYGTFRARMKTSQVAGTVAAFFYYRNTTSEIDIETLSKFRNPAQAYFAIQPQIYNPDGSASPQTHHTYPMSFDPTQEYHEYRFDWMPGLVKFYIDGLFIRDMTINVPETPGRIMINHWTDGNPNFSGGPPEEDADLIVSHLNMFFNSSEQIEPPPCQKSKEPCKVQDIMSNNLLPGTALSSASITSYNQFFYLFLLVLFTQF